MSKEASEFGIFLAAAWAVAFVVVNVRGCSETEAHYRAERYKACIAANNAHRDCQ